MSLRQVEWRLTVFALLGTALSPCCGRGDDEIFDHMKAIDSLYEAGFFAEGQLTTTIRDNESLHESFRYTRSEQQHAIETIRDLEETFTRTQAAGGESESPSTTPSGMPSGVASSGGVSLMRQQRVLFDDDLTGALNVDASFEMSLGGLVETGRAYAIEQYPADSDRYVMYYLRFLLPSGHGFTQYIDDVTRVEETPGGLYRVTAIGGIKSTLSGEWQLLVEPAAMYLVRKASLRLDSTDEIFCTVQTSGLRVEGDCHYPESGVLYLGAPPEAIDTEYAVTFARAQLEFADSFFADVRGQLTDRIPNGSFIQDYRSDPPELYSITEQGEILGKSGLRSGQPLQPPERSVWRPLIIANAAFVLVLIAIYGYRRRHKASAPAD